MGIVGIFLLKSLPVSELGKLALFPSLILWSIEFLSLLILSNFKETKNFSVRVFILSILPPLLFIKITRDWIKEQKEAGNPLELYLGVYLLIGISALFMILSALVIGFAFLLSQNRTEIILRLIYILFLGPLSMIGWWVGGSMKFHSLSKPNKGIIVGTLILIWLVIFVVPYDFPPVYF